MLFNTYKYTCTHDVFLIAFLLCSLTHTQVRRANFRITKLRLGSVRPFEFEHVALRDAVPPLLPEDGDGVGEFLARKVCGVCVCVVGGMGRCKGPIQARNVCENAYASLAIHN